MMLASLFAFLSLFSQESDSLVVIQDLEGGRRLEAQVRLEQDGSQTRHGSFTLINARGKKVVLGNYKNGERDGDWRYRTEKGKSWVNGQFSKGLRSGKWNFRSEKKVVLAEGEYANGLPTGKWRFRTLAGDPDPRNSGIYAPLFAHHSNGNLQYQGCTLDGAIHGPFTFYWQNGVKQLASEFDRGKRVGHWRFWHSDGSEDKGFLSNEYGPGPFLWEFFEEPIAIPGKANSPAAQLDVDVPLQEPNQLIAFTNLPPNGELERALAACHAADRARHAEAQLSFAQWGREQLPYVLEALRKLDYTQSDERMYAERLLRQAVPSIFNGHSLLSPASPVEESSLRLAVLRLHSLHWLSVGTESWWSVELPALHHSREAMQADCIMMRPRLPIEALYAAGLQNPLYALRFAKDKHLKQSGGLGTQPALLAALGWIAINQRPDGSWISSNLGDVLGVSGLALLALVGDGNTLDTGPHTENVQRSIRFLLQNQEPSTGRFWYVHATQPKEKGQPVRRIRYGDLYGHAIATTVMCELASSSQNKTLLAAAQRGIDFIESARNPYGAWGYKTPPDGTMDTSSTGWMLSAMHAGKQAGLRVNETAIVDALEFLSEMTVPSTGLVGYRDRGSSSSREASNLDIPRDLGEALTAVGLYSRLLFSIAQDHQKRIKLQSEILLRKLPEWGEPWVDMYYWYYGTYAMRRVGGKAWKKWNAAMKDTILGSQRQAPDSSEEELGSWDPVGVWCHRGKRTYATAMMALCLESYYRFDRQAL